MKVNMITHTPNPEKVVAAAAKLCYSPATGEELYKGLTDKKAKEFVERLMKMRHESPLEHASFTFAVDGISRACSHQLVRHRLASYSQKSQRYVEEGLFDYVIPPEIEQNELARMYFEIEMAYSKTVYKDITKLLEQEGRTKEQAREDARFVLPNACRTNIVVTMNARQLLHFFEVRCCNRAQWEIREMADEMLRQCREVAPVLFGNAGPGCINGKGCPEGQMSCGKPREDLRCNAEQQAEEHPKKTYMDVFFEVFPSARTREDGTPKACVIDIFGENSVDCNTSGYCGLCWDREYKEDEE